VTNVFIILTKGASPNNDYEVIPGAATPPQQPKAKFVWGKKRAGICLQTFSKRILTLAKDFFNFIQTDLKRKSLRQKTNKWYMANNFLYILQTDLNMLQRTCAWLQKFSKRRYGVCWQTVWNSLRVKSFIYVWNAFEIKTIWRCSPTCSPFWPT
jgi:hypothetical protein